MIVSVVLLTYNHERFIRQAIDSVLLQQGDFEIELLISEDCSTDTTREIVGEYATRHPDTIRVLLSPHNLNTNEVTARAIRVARGDYIAMLDGDDYWTSPQKLQKQIAFLEQHPECSMCFHDVQYVHGDGSPVPLGKDDRSPPEFASTHDLLRGNFIAGCSPMFRRSALAALPDWYVDVHWGDWPLYVLATEGGPAGFLNEILGAYRVHGGGYWSGQDSAVQLRATVQFYSELDVHFGHRYHRAIEKGIAMTYFRLARIYRSRGLRGATWSAAARALSKDPLGQQLPRGRLMRYCLGTLRPRW